jgi:hypothetical protein
MAAIQRTRISSSVVGMFVVAVAAALLVGGAGGYLVRAVSPRASVPATVVDNPSAKAADHLPAWLQKYDAPAGPSQFKVDEFIRSLDYASLESPRTGGPGGQFGDPDQTSREGGPGGQLGDAL